MTASPSQWWKRPVRQLLLALPRPEVLAFLPALTLAGFWIWGDRALVAMAVGMPPLLLLAGVARSHPRPSDIHGAGGAAGMALRPQIIDRIDAILSATPDSGRTTGCLVVLFDDPDGVLDRHGRAAQAEVLERSTERLCGALRGGDAVARLEGGGLAVALAPARRLDLETMIQIAARLQEALSPPVSLGAARIYVSCSVGFALVDLVAEATGRALLDAAQTAAEEARRHGPGAIRAFAPDMARTRADRDARRDGLEQALEDGEFQPWFQPQVDAATGNLTGVEALARWHHPDGTLTPPRDFLPLLEDAGLSERLGEVILLHVLTRLADWDRAGLDVPSVSINLSAAELRNPRLADRLKWELDRFSMPPGRLTVEILESVVAGDGNDVVVANVAALSRMGCRVDLDDFGTGHASITTIRRFAIRRLKIDRSFVTALDSDVSQRRMVAGILSLADRMGLETLAEGVETAAEQAALRDLGCGHLQGFHIARPMPGAAFADWLGAHNRRLRPTGAARPAQR